MSSQSNFRNHRLSLHDTIPGICSPGCPCATSVIYGAGPTILSLECYIAKLVVVDEFDNEYEFLPYAPEWDLTETLYNLGLTRVMTKARRLISEYFDGRYGNIQFADRFWRLFGSGYTLIYRFHPAVDFYTDNFTVASQLNGSNGEWTNTDDLDNAERVRMRREADTNRFRRNPGARRRRQFGPMENPRVDRPCRDFLAGNCMRENCLFNHPAPAVVEPRADEDDEPELPVCRTFHGLRYVVTEKKCKIPEGEHIVEHDTVVQCRVPAFMMFSRLFPEKDVLVSVELYNMLRAEARILPDECRNYVATMNIATTLFSAVFPQNVIMDLVHFYSFKISHYATPHDVAAVGRHYMTSVNHSLVRVIPVAQSGNRNYIYNRSWRIREARGFSMDVAEDGSWARPPQFATIAEVNPNQNRCKRALCQFSPYNDFKYYGNTAENVIDALSRYFKIRAPTLEENEVMKQNQFKLLSRDEDDVITLVAACCKATYENGQLTTRQVYHNVRERRAHNHYHVQGNDSEFIRILRKSWFGSSTKVYRSWLKFQQIMQACYSDLWNSAVEMLYSPIFHAYDWLSRLISLAELPHPKRLLRRRWVTDEKSISRIYENTGIFESKFKWEAAKVGKPGRLYATIECNSLVAHSTMSVVKFITTLPVFLGYYPDGGRAWAQYSDSVAPAQSDELFRKVSDLGVGDSMYIFFSDDGFFIYNDRGVLTLLETDISSCDASNGFPVSAVCFWIASQLNLQHGMSELLVISSKPTKVFNPDNREEYVLLEPETTFEYSGETLTTLKNNVASIAIAFGMYKRMVEGFTPERSAVLGAQDFGWVLTVDQKFSFNAVTFLKRAYSIRSQRSWCVYGPILRSMGLVDGEVTHISLGVPKSDFRKMSYSEMLDCHLRSRMDTLQHEPSSPIVNALRARAYGEEYSTNFVITHQDLVERYGCYESDIDELVSYILTLKVGDYIMCNMLECIFSVDYGVEKYVFPPVDLYPHGNADALI